MAPEPAFLLTLLILLAGDSSARELRPSDHGLIFQTLSPANYSQEMRSFFNTDDKSMPSSASSSVALPKAINSGEALPPSWRTATAVHGVGDRFGKALLAGSVVCGIAGAVLLVASGLVYVLKYRKQKKLNAAFHSSENGNDGENNNNSNSSTNTKTNNNKEEEENKLQLAVVSNP
ncbi:hypothetical protein RIF29_42132 [Crotalaria pallida]|uniref:Uncharacterized protein n=1 Tax=Crotalaria pallida TaxID=3830 RepID=A0AAN9E996_CROPI